MTQERYRVSLGPPTNHAAIAAILDSGEFTPGEKWMAKYLVGQVGNFFGSLAQSIAAADDNNREKLARGFPDEVQGWLSWIKGDLAKRLLAAGLEV